MNAVNVAKLHAELDNAGIPIEGVSSDGRIDFLPAATEAQRALAADILKQHDPVDYAALRWAEYPDVKRILLALLSGGDELDAVKTAMRAVDAKYASPAG